jgi:hypothetical protein
MEFGMTKWQRELDLTPDYEQCDAEDEDQLRALASMVATKIRAIPVFTDVGSGHINARMLTLAIDFEDLPKAPYVDKTDFNRLMVWLYQWGDTSLERGGFTPVKVCWIIT